MCDPADGSVADGTEGFVAIDLLRRKLTVRAHGRSLVLIKRPIESAEHVLQKALLWALYLPQYPDLRVEVQLPTPSRYKPDLLALDAQQQPSFWAECGVVGIEKLQFVLNRYRRTHFVFSKWETRLDQFAELIEQVLQKSHRSAPVELLGIPETAGDWIKEDGTVEIDPGQIETRRWE